jgi:hypothetical protein
MRHRKPSRLVSTLVAVRNFCTIAKAGITDLIAILALCGVGVNLVWCMRHGKEIEQLQNAAKQQQAQVEQQKKSFVPAVIAHKFNFF